MTQKSRYFLIAASAVLILGVGGGLVAYLAYKRSPNVPAGIPVEVRYVPADAALVAYVNVRAVMASELRRELIPHIEAGSRKGRRMMNDFAGIDVETQVDHLLAYVERSEASVQASEAPKPPRAVMMVQGTFQQPRIEQFVREHQGTIENYNGHTISVHQKGNEEIALGFVRPDLIAVGQSSLVRRVLDLSNDTSAKTQGMTANAELMSLIRDVSGSTAWAVGYFDAMSRGLPAAVGRQVPPLRLISARADVNGGVKATVRADTADAPAAEQLREVVRSFVALARLQAAGKPQFEAAAKSIQLSGTDKTVQLTFVISPETMRALAPRPLENSEQPGTPKDPAPQR